MFYSKVLPAHRAAAELITQCIDTTDALPFYCGTTVQPENFLELSRLLLKVARKELPHLSVEYQARHKDKALVEQWLQGLPTLCSVPHTYHDIDQLIAKGLIPADALDAKAESSIGYWKYLSYVICLYAAK